MRISRRCLRLPLLLAVLWLCGVVAGAENVGARVRDTSYRAAIESIRADELGRHVEQLADEEMEGREAGSRGGLAAAKYLAEQYARLRLHGAGNDGGFFQNFPPNFRNVLAMIEGSDPKLRDEVIIVGAHYDHVGRGGFAALGPPGYVYPGADDNASGTAAVLELAEACTFLSRPPRRSILFAHWDAEEKGLLGSRHWVADPTISLGRVAATLNLDMIGRLRNERLIVMGSRSGAGWRRLVSLHNVGNSLRLDFPWEIKPRADEYPFFDHDIPVLMFHTGLHRDYHRPSDSADRVDRQGMGQVTRLVFGVAYELADRPAAVPAFRAEARYETADAELAADRMTKPADRLGVGWTEDIEPTGGVSVSMVAAGSAADRAGLRPGDRIVRINDHEIFGDDDFIGTISAAESPVTLEVHREGEKKMLRLVAQLSGKPLRWGILWRVDGAEPGVAILTHVVPGSVAAQAGLKSGDRVYQVGGRDFADETEFLRLVKKNPSGPLSLLIERDGRLRTVVLPPRRAEPIRRAA